MERPINISPSVYDFIASLISSQDQINTIATNPIPFLIKHDIFNHLNILLNSVFKLETGEEVKINEESIKDLKQKTDIHLLRLYDQKILIVSYNDFKEQFHQSEVLDYVTE
ncbi:MAG: hypothetical protein AB9915_00300 [Candidatus Dojkabacteria bacterium]